MRTVRRIRTSLFGLATLAFLMLLYVAPGTAGAVTVKPLVFGSGYHDLGENPVTLANTLKANGLKHLRIDIDWTGCGAGLVVKQRTKDIVSALTANGIEVEAIIDTHGAEYLHGAAPDPSCVVNSTNYQTHAYAEAKNQVDALKVWVRDFEMENEVGLYPAINPENRPIAVRPPAPFTRAADYNVPAAQSMAAVLRGISQAISDSSTTTVPLRSILGATDNGSSGLLLFMQQVPQSVVFDIVGLHTYPRLGDTPRVTDPWYGTNPLGFIGLFRQFNKPIHVNEFNCGETYDAYVNEVGSQTMNACLASINRHLPGLVAASDIIERIDFYEIADEPAKCPGTSNPECRFGLTFSLTGQKKPLLDLAASYPLSLAPTLSNTDYVANLFRLLLGREPDTAGLNAYVTALNNGTSTRTNVQAGILASSERATRVAANNYSLPTSLTGLSQAQYVDTAYRTLLQRTQTGSERYAWAFETKPDVLKALLSSSAYAVAYPSVVVPAVVVPAALTDSQYVTGLYQFLLGRTPATAEVNSWTTSGKTRAQMKSDFLASTERTTRVAAGRGLIPSASLGSLSRADFVVLAYRVLLDQTTPLLTDVRDKVSRALSRAEIQNALLPTYP